MDYGHKDGNLSSDLRGDLNYWRQMDRYILTSSFRIQYTGVSICLKSRADRGDTFEVTI